MFKRAIITTCIAVMLSGCGVEDRPYDTYERATEEITVQSLDTESLWMFMPSTTETPRYAMTQRGFFQGDPKLVTLRFDESNGIYAEEVDRDKVTAGADSRWDSDINRAPVLKIPGEFRQYRCAENSYGECTNKEEINRDEDLDWKQATHFVPKYEDIKSLSEDTLSAWFTATNVTETAEPRLISYEYNPEAGVINVELERTFTASPEDQYQFGNDMRDLSFKTRFFYSLVKLDKLASKDYEPVYYQGQDSAYFGFFNDHKEVKTHTGESNIQGSKFAYLNRFNPNKESIDYYLSDSYFNADAEDFRQLTIDTISQVNNTLKGTGVPAIRIVNPTKKAGVKTGDLRYNVFNLIADPVDNGLLGYGPSATNPLTGEIIHAHVNQYLGVIRSTSRHFWNDLAMRYNRQEVAKLEPKVEAAPEVSAITLPVDTTDKTGTEKFVELVKASQPDISELNLSEREIAFVTKSMQPEALPKADFDFKFDTENKDLALQSFHKHKELLKRFSEQNVYSVDHMWVSTNAKGLVKGIDYSAGGFFTSADQTALKQWDDLSLEQQKLASKAISKHMFKSTLIHELGHNLGLRHNFMGSVDKDNFYTQEELNAKGVEDKPAAYSSIMDYGASIFDELLSYGKYDKAALKFAYAREIETSEYEFSTDKDGAKEALRDSTGAQKRKVFSLAKYDQEMSEDYNAYPTGIVTYLRTHSDQAEIPALATYRYCTDEHTTTNLLCDRFDEGTNLQEVTAFRIQQYEDSYDTMNRRNGRNSFYQYHQYNYFLNRWSQFQSIRDIVENVGDIDHMFANYIGANSANTQGLVFKDIAGRNCLKYDYRTRKNVPIPYDDLDPGLRPICDTHNASVLAADFFLKILNTPDKICETEEIASGTENRYRFTKLSQLWETYRSAMSPDRDVPTTCFDKELEEVLAAQKNKMVVLSETKDGKIWASLQANNPYQSSSSSVDLLGIWPDKLLAAQMLVRRDTPNVATERSNLALIDVEDKARYVYASLSGVMSIPDPEAPKVKFVDRNGDDISTVEEYKYPASDTIEATPSYLWPMKRFFGIGGDEAFSYWTEGNNQDTRVPYLAALLTNLDKFGRQAEFGLSDNARLLRDAIHINYADSSYDDGENSVAYTRKGRKYLINRQNTLGLAIADLGLYGKEQQARVAKMNSMGGDVRTLFTPLTKAEGRSATLLKEARVIALRDVDVINGLQSSSDSGTVRNFVRDNFVEYEVDDKTCLRFKKEGESEAEREARACIPSDRLNQVKSSIGNIDDDRFELLKEQAAKLANNYNAMLNGGKVEKIRSWNNSTYESNYGPKPNQKDTFDYPVEEILSWLNNDYNEYRRVLEQFPVYEN